MKKIILSSVIIFCISNLFGQNVSNKKSELTEQKMVVRYDLVSNSANDEFSVQLDFEDNSVKPKTVVPNLDQRQKPGVNKKITWYFKQDGFTKEDIQRLNFRVKAECLNCKPPDTKKPCKIAGIPPGAGLGGVVLLGGSLFIPGAKKFSDSKKSRDTYAALDVGGRSNWLIENYPDIQDDDELYTELNSDHKNGQWLMIGGAAIIVVGGAVFIKRMIDCKRMSNRLSIRPAIELPTTVPSSAFGGSVGAQIKYTF